MPKKMLSLARSILQLRDFTGYMVRETKLIIGLKKYFTSVEKIHFSFISMQLPGGRILTFLLTKTSFNAKNVKFGISTKKYSNKSTHFQEIVSNKISPVLLRVFFAPIVCRGPKRGKARLPHFEVRFY